MSAPVVHFEILGTDGKRLQSFYSELFGWSIDADNPMGYGVVERTEGGIGGGVATGQSGPQVTVYAVVDDLDACLKQAEALGGKVVVPPTEIPGMVTFAQFADPDGNVVGIVLPPPETG